MLCVVNNLYQPRGACQLGKDELLSMLLDPAGAYVRFALCQRRLSGKDELHSGLLNSAGAYVRFALCQRRLCSSVPVGYKQQQYRT